MSDEDKPSTFRFIVEPLLMLTPWERDFVRRHQRAFGDVVATAELIRWEAAREE